MTLLVFTATRASAEEVRKALCGYFEDWQKEHPKAIHKESVLVEPSACNDGLWRGVACAEVEHETD